MPLRPALRLTELRHDALRFLHRTDLDTCLLVSRLWSKDVSGLGDQLALRPLKTMDIIYVSYTVDKAPKNRKCNL